MRVSFFFLFLCACFSFSLFLSQCICAFVCPLMGCLCVCQYVYFCVCVFLFSFVFLFLFLPSPCSSPSPSPSRFGPRGAEGTYGLAHTYKHPTPKIMSTNTHSYTREAETSSITKTPNAPNSKRTETTEAASSPSPPELRPLLHTHTPFPRTFSLCPPPATHTHTHTLPPFSRNTTVLRVTRPPARQAEATGSTRTDSPAPPPLSRALHRESGPLGAGRGGGRHRGGCGSWWEI